MFSLPGAEIHTARFLMEETHYKWRNFTSHLTFLMNVQEWEEWDAAHEEETEAI